ncbi:Glutamine synthetase, putative [Perkinsus marinus ATCC 50983]|uniref:Glutamine synthetase, putative n=1 Tax=Perkinsus marinus (strain ATCC 50983 / TXsc) TaxID=423536 RepID=C5LZG6_PERM5|nr:Glutamine synthetase, putative [Perkinsus marinus ATCC 50983]EEQ97960.1 Glutamine synthetase, putative [Perkinsus marinus ATCC 50983]|eukprot:XP_002765243.1 Glutamine synthetase, putative [Perkinsus marinus ATCC 50983]
MTTARVEAISSIVDRAVHHTSQQQQHDDNNNNTDASSTFGEHVFSTRVMESRLPSHVYHHILSCIKTRSMIHPEIADTVASAMKDWALQYGATHFTHVFYPYTASTAEKHDSFIEPRGDGTAFTKFDGKALMQGEPDASSFPHGGIRDTYEARGYTAWDVTSPAYLMDKGQCLTLCIPTAFVSYTGEVIDLKTPLLRSMDAVSVAAKRLISFLVDDVNEEEIDEVMSYVGSEQEYFLIDKKLAVLRPDIITCGRTLFGATPAKTQQFDDHYFAAIPDRVLKFMSETERRLYRLGVPIKCRHNEVAPGQFEIVPLYETANIASDHQHLIMQILRNTASKHGFQCLLHEKPFTGVNGSGKHINWSLGNNTQGNLFNPTESPSSNTLFLMFVSAVIRAVDVHAGLLRGCVASASNDCRLGGEEAPPAVMSVYLGDQLNDVFDQIKHSIPVNHERNGSGDFVLETRVRRSSLSLGASTLPDINKDAGDRNRTSPFAFTEFACLTDMLEERLHNGTTANVEYAAKAVIRDNYREHGRVVFNGDGYSNAWKEEAEKRGLKNIKRSPQAIAEYGTSECIQMFERCNVLSKNEVLAEEEVFLDKYTKKVVVEANCALRMVRTIILPVCRRYQSQLAEDVINVKEALGGGCGGPRDDDDDVTASIKEELRDLTNTINEMCDSMKHLEKEVNALEKISDDVDDYIMLCAQFAADHLVPSLEVLRSPVDKLETIVSNDMWPLPTYQELLHMK